ncbi:toll/interleukin-1 receptor domain-containing protein [Streptomyces vastus]|uniref:TIR domain-containing protein n=1 Tax=Streptomyces vastus TaxID=285451 RepID=A0ABN3QGV3_9ACTN
MPEIFINYRTGDGDHLAATLDEALGHRFGADTVFRDGRSIRPGSEYPHELLSELRKSSVLLVVIGPDWVTAPRLRDPDDWVRREILEAHACRIPIIPILGDPSVTWLRREELPQEISWLAELQSLRYAPYTSTTDLARIGDELADRIKSLTDTQRPSPTPDPAVGTHNSVSGGNQGTLAQGRDFSGDIAGTIYKNNTGPFHTGTGDQHTHHHTNSPRFSGDGGTFVAGDNHGGIRHTFRRDERHRGGEDEQR